MKKLIMTIMLTASAMLFTGCWVTSEGEKIGQITAIAEQGAFVKTWEAQIVRGGMNNGSGVTGQVTHFTIENNPELVKDLTDAMNNGKEVKIIFEKEMATFLRSESDNVFAKSMQVIETKGLKVQESNNTIAGNKISPEDLNALALALSNILNKK